MAGKYAHLIARLPKLLPPDAKYQEKVEETKRLILEEHDHAEILPASTLVSDYAEIRGEIDRINKQLYDANLKLEAVSQMLVSRFDDEDITSLKVADASVRVQHEPYAQVKDKEKFRLWCVNTCQLCGLHRDKHPIPSETAEFLNLHPNHAPVTLEAQLQLWPSTMNSITKERLLKGYPEPDGVEAYQKPKIVLTRDKE